MDDDDDDGENQYLGSTSPVSALPKRDSLQPRINFDKWKNTSEQTKLSDFGGLKNIGNTCYINAVLQSLFALPSFKQALCDVNISGEHPTKLPAPLPSSSFFACLAKIATQLTNGVSSGVIDVGQVKRVFGSRFKDFAGFRQQDAHEFMIASLDHLTEDLIAVFKRQYYAKRHKENRTDEHMNDVSREPSSTRQNYLIDDSQLDHQMFHWTTGTITAKSAAPLTRQ